MSTTPSASTAAPHDSTRGLTIFVHAGFVVAGAVTILLGPILPMLAARWSLRGLPDRLLFSRTISRRHSGLRGFQFRDASLGLQEILPRQFFPHWSGCRRSGSLRMDRHSRRDFVCMARVLAFSVRQRISGSAKPPKPVGPALSTSSTFHGQPEHGLSVPCGNIRRPRTLQFFALWIHRRHRSACDRVHISFRSISRSKPDTESESSARIVKLKARRRRSHLSRFSPSYSESFSSSKSERRTPWEVGSRPTRTAIWHLARARGSSPLSILGWPSPWTSARARNPQKSLRDSRRPSRSRCSPSAASAF